MVQDQLLHHTEADESDTEQVSLGTNGDLDVSSPNLLSELCWLHPDVHDLNDVPDTQPGKF